MKAEQFRWSRGFTETQVAQSNDANILISLVTKHAKSNNRRYVDVDELVPWDSHRRHNVINVNYIVTPTTSNPINAADHRP